MNKTHYNTLFFDLDGTLINSVNDITYALNKMRAHFALAPICDQTTASIIGRGFPTTTQKVLSLDLAPDKVATYANDALKLTLDYYEEAMGQHTHIYPGVINALTHFKELKIKMAVVTNKEEAHAIKTLEHLGLSQYFDCVIGGDTTPFYKPNPAPLEHAARMLNADITTSLMIGDSANDAYCAEAYNMPYILISHGYANGVNLHSLNALAVIKHFDELKDYIIG